MDPSKPQPDAATPENPPENPAENPADAAPESAQQREAPFTEEPVGPTPLPDKPRLRPLEAYPVHNPGALNPQQRLLLALRDPSGLAEAVVTLPPSGAAVVDLLDGTLNHDQLLAEFQRRHRAPLARESLLGLLQRLDDALLLDSPRFRAHAARVFGAFARATARPALHAGKLYPAEPAALRAALDGTFAPPRGPGLPAPATENAAPRAIIVPHTEFARGGPAYAWGYEPLLRAGQLPDLVVLLGTDHGALDSGFTLTRKHFETPLGVLATDQALVEQLLSAARAAEAPAKGLAEALLRDEHHHRGETSLELQAVWLRHAMASRGVSDDALRILPVLCGSMLDFVHAREGQQDPVGGPLAARVFTPFLTILGDALRQAVAAGRRVLILCSAELAQVGPRFGDRDGLSDEDCDSLERRDRETLRSVVKGDAAGWFAELRREKDQRRVSGLAPIYVALRLLDVVHGGPVTGQLRCYAQIPSSDSASSPLSVTSLATVVFP